MTIRHFAYGDLAVVSRLWTAVSCEADVLYKPMSVTALMATFDNPNYDPAYSFVAEVDGQVVGFVNGICKKIFYPGENNANTPGYLTIVMVDAAHRRCGIGRALVDTLLAAFRACGKTLARVSETNPVWLSWTVPGTEGHDHNKAPGVDVDGSGYPFLLALGFVEKHREVAMYLDLKHYQVPENFEAAKAKLLAEGIQTGLYDPQLGYDFNRMCDNVHSEYWRSVLIEETAKRAPRPILAATTGGFLVGFTGPVDRQPSGRGFFTGICTDPNYERRGIAFVLFNHLMQAFIEKGCAFSTLFTGTENHAQKLYLRTGFAVKRVWALMEKGL